MHSLLSRLLGRDPAPRPGGRGVVFASDVRDPRWADAAPGTVIRNETREPPWIVVAHDPDAVSVVGWPGRLWEAEILEPASDQPRRGAGYTRAVAIRVIREVPLAMLYGPHGEGVVRVLERAGALDQAQAEALGTRVTAAAGDAYARAWRSWLDRVRPGSIHADADHSCTLAVPPAPESPIGHGFITVHGVLHERVRNGEGDAGFIVADTEDGDGEVSFAEPWRGALYALLHAALALGAPELLPDADREALLAPWRHVFGDD